MKNIFENFKVDLFTEHQNPKFPEKFRYGESPLEAFTKFNGLLNFLKDSYVYTSALEPSETNSYMIWLDVSDEESPRLKVRSEDNTTWKMLDNVWEKVPYEFENLITKFNQYVVVDGKSFVINPSTDLPYKLKGVWELDSKYFWMGGDSTLEDRLSAPNGTTLIGHKDETLAAYLERTQDKSSVDVYKSGLELSENSLFIYESSIYMVRPGVETPLTLTGDWAIDRFKVTESKDNIARDGFDERATWSFLKSIEGWYTPSSATTISHVATYPQHITATTTITSGTSRIGCNVDMGFSISQYPFLKLRFRFQTGVPVTSGLSYVLTNDRAEIVTATISLDQVKHDKEWQTLELNLLERFPEWANETITRIQLFNVRTNPFDLQWMTIGRYSPKRQNPDNTIVKVHPFIVSKTDNTEEVRKAHEHANSLGAMVSYEGVKEIHVKANARIKVNTQSDFSGCLIHIIPEEPSSAYKTAFEVEGAPYSNTTTHNIPDEQLKAGSLNPTTGFYNGPGYVRLLCNEFKVPGRETADALGDYDQSFYVGSNGQVSHPLSADLRGFGTKIKLRWRDDDPYIKISGMIFKESNWTAQTLVKVNRNNVDLEMALWADPNVEALPLMASDSLVSVYNVANVNIDIRHMVQRQYNNTGTYGLTLNGYASGTVKIRGYEGVDRGPRWGITGCNFVNGLLLKDSIVDRMDVHASGHNITTENTTFTNIGITIGWGGGLIHAKNCYANNSSIYRARGSWGGGAMYNGTIKLTNCESMNNEKGYGTNYMNAVVRMNEIGGRQAEIHAPDIIIDGLTLRGEGYHTAIFMRKATAASAVYDVYAPKIVSLSNIISDKSLYGDVADLVKISYWSFTKNPAIKYHQFSLNNLVSNDKKIITFHESGQVPTNPTTSIQFKFSGCSELAVNFESVKPSLNSTIDYVHFNDSCVASVDASSFTGNISLGLLSSCIFKTVGSSKIDMPNTRITSGVVMGESRMDFSTVKGMSGVHVLNTNATLPSAITRAMCLQGWDRDIS